MKKLMMAAAVAAMTAGAFAENNWTNVVYATEITSNKVGVAWVVTTNDVDSIELPTTSIVTFKQAKSSSKAFSLNYKDFQGEGKKFKAFKNGAYAWSNGDDRAGVTQEARDGVIYYDASTNAWVKLTWSKNQIKTKVIGVGAPTFTVYGDNGDIAKAKKAYAAYGTINLDGGTNLATKCYAKLKIKKGELDTTIKSLKNVDSNTKYSVKNYKDAEACKKAVDKLLKKYNKGAAKEVVNDWL